MSTYTTRKYRELLVKFSNRERVKFHHGKAEVEGELDARLAEFAAANPEYGIEKVEGEEPVETNKQRLQREARELGLSDAGKVAELEARIAEKRAEDAAGDDDADDADSGDESDGDSDDNASEGESSEADENTE